MESAFFHFIYISILIFAMAGFVVSWYIEHKKRKKEKLICIIGEDCDKILNSRYGRVFGVPLEVFGMLYYAVVVLLSVLLLAGTKVVGALTVACILVSLGAFAAFFSVVLIYIQCCVIKEWCEYCLASTGISIFIFALEIILIK